MTYAWKPGDKAVAIRTYGGPFPAPIKNEIYTVVETTMGATTAGLCFKELENPPNNRFGWAAFNFRPLIKDTPEKADEEFLNLMQGISKKVRDKRLPVRYEDRTETP